MDVAIAGAHGQIARLLTRRLVAHGDRVRGLVRNPDHVDDVRADGAEALVCDLEVAPVEEVEAAVAGADAVVFAAGAGPGSGAQRKWTVDRDGAVKLLQAAERHGARRYVMVSAVGAASPPQGEDVFSVYLRAKAEADLAVMGSHLDWVVLRPGRLTDGEGTGTVRLDHDVHRGEVARDDVAAVLHAVLHHPSAAGQVLYVNGGDVPVDEALERAVVSK